MSATQRTLYMYQKISATQAGRKAAASAAEAVKKTAASVTTVAAPAEAAVAPAVEAASSGVTTAQYLYAGAASLMRQRTILQQR